MPVGTASAHHGFLFSHTLFSALCRLTERLEEAIPKLAKISCNQPNAISTPVSLGYLGK